MSEKDISTNCRTALVVDDHANVRLGTSDILAAIGGIEVVSEASNGDEAVERAMLHRPDLVLMDINMPEKDGIAATRAITRQLPKTSVLILTAHDSPEYLVSAIQAGAAGFLLKSAEIPEYADAIEAIFDGGTPMDTDLMARALKELAHQKEKTERESTHRSLERPLELDFPRPPWTPLENLSPREHEALLYIADGLTNEQVAKKMFVALPTVKNYVKNILYKLEVGNRTQAAAKAIQFGILDPS